AKMNAELGASRGLLSPSEAGIAMYGAVLAIVVILLITYYYIRMRRKPTKQKNNFFKFRKSS
ncbi:MAG: hypothetical protein PHS02_03995, partial [Candidatus ainarchaeum sp.]|nr:hypothetical protein [Candidatus ainarchaeum sp.]